MENALIIQHLQRFLAEQDGKPTDKRTACLYAKLRSVTEDEISLGNPPSYCFACLRCNSTGVGKSSFEGTETQRTVARDYVTDEKLFIDGHIGAGVKGLELFYLKQGEQILYYDLKESARAATEYGFRIHQQYFRDLNFMLTDHRLNRHTVELTKKPFQYPIRPIFATLRHDGTKITVGYLYEKDGREFVLIEPELPDRKQRNDGIGCAPWMLLGIVFPPVLIAAGICLLVKYGKRKAENMTGVRL